MYTIDINILYFLGFDSVNMDDRLGFRRGDIDLKYYAVLIDTHVADLLVCIIFLGDTYIVENNIIGIRMIETDQNLVFVIHSYNFSGFLKCHICAFVFAFVKEDVGIAVVKQ